jgi:hypothetical protein
MLGLEASERTRIRQLERRVDELESQLDTRTAQNVYFARMRRQSAGEVAARVIAAYHRSVSTAMPTGRVGRTHRMRRERRACPT